MTNNHSKRKHWFKDSNGRITIVQWPNVPLCGWALFNILARVVDSPAHKASLSDLSTALLFVWAYLEITQGVNYFRRLLGTAVLAAVLAGYFR